MLLQRHGTRVDPSERTPRPRFHAAYRRNASPSDKRFPSDRTPSVTARASHYVASFTPSHAEMPLRHATAPHALQAVASSRRPVPGHAAHPTTTRTNTPPGARPAPMGRTPDPQLVSKLACPIIIRYCCLTLPGARPNGMPTTSPRAMPSQHRATGTGSPLSTNIHVTHLMLHVFTRLQHGRPDGAGSRQPRAIRGGYDRDNRMVGLPGSSHPVRL